MTGNATDIGGRGSEVVERFLGRHHAAYELIEHSETFAAVDEARTAGTPLGRMAKTLVLHDHGGYRMAVIPASERLDLRKARAALGASRHLRLASEDEIEREFPAFDVGAMPPLSGLLGTPEILDTRLLGHGDVLCSGGDHRHTLRIAPHEIERLGAPLVADLCAPHLAVPDKDKPLTHQPKGDAMPAATTTRTPATRQPVTRRRVGETARARAQDTERRLELVMQSLEAAQKDLAAIGGTLGTGARDLRRDATRLLRDARRDVLKMRRSVQRDLLRLQKNLTAAATAKPAPTARRKPTTTTTRTARRRTTASAHAPRR